MIKSGYDWKISEENEQLMRSKGVLCMHQLLDTMGLDSDKHWLSLAIAVAPAPEDTLDTPTNMAMWLRFQQFAGLSMAEVIAKLEAMPQPFSSGFNPANVVTYADNELCACSVTA